MIWLSLMEGFRRTGLMIHIIGVVWVLQVVFVLPAAWTIEEAIRTSIGASLVADNLREGFDMDWYGEFQFQARGLARTFSPTVVGVGPILTNIEVALEGRLFRYPAALVGIALGYGLLWIFLLGGILSGVSRRSELFAREAPRGFLSACGYYFPALAALTLVGFLLYSIVFGLIVPRLFRLVEWGTRDIPREWPVFWATVGAYAGTAALLIFIRTMLDYAKISCIAGAHRNPLWALGTGVRFVIRHPLRVGGVVASVGLVYLVVFFVYGWLAPGVRQSTVLSVGGAFLFGQAYLFSRLFLRIVMLASETALFERTQTSP